MDVKLPIVDIIYASEAESLVFIAEYKKKHIKLFQSIYEIASFGDRSKEERDRLCNEMVFLLKKSKRYVILKKGTLKKEEGNYGNFNLC